MADLGTPERNPLLEQVTTAFDHFIQKHGFRVAESRYEPESFGNALVVLEREPVRVRVSSDRGDVLVEIASTRDPENWYPLRSVLSTLGNVAVDDQPLALTQIAVWLEQHEDLLNAWFRFAALDETKRKLEAVGVVGEAEHQERVRKYLRERRKE